MDNEMMTKAIELSFTILEDMIMLRPLTTKEDLTTLAQNAAKKVQEGKEYPEVLRVAYKEMLNKLKNLTFDEIKEIREIIED